MFLQQTFETIISMDHVVQDHTAWPTVSLATVDAVKFLEGNAIYGGKVFKFKGELYFPNQEKNYIYQHNKTILSVIRTPEDKIRQIIIRRIDQVLSLMTNSSGTLVSL